MKAKLIVDGKEFEIDINHPELEKLIKPEKKTGYERVGEGHTYSFVNTYGEIKTLDYKGFDDDLRYDNANYYSDKTVAENNARADKLMRQLRRFAVEHREKELIWTINIPKFSLYYDYVKCDNEIHIGEAFICRDFGVPYFDTYETAALAIKTFHDELIWYFTEYKDSL